MIYFDWLLHHILQFLIFYLVFLTVARQNWFKLFETDLIWLVIASYFAILDFLFGIPRCWGVILGSSWSHPGVILESSWSHPGVILESSLSHPGVILESSWIIPDSYCSHTGSSWGHPGVILGSSWGHPGVILESSLSHPWVILESTWSHPGSSWVIL